MNLCVQVENSQWLFLGLYFVVEKQVLKVGIKDF